MRWEGLASCLPCSWLIARRAWRSCKTVFSGLSPSCKVIIQPALQSHQTQTVEAPKHHDYTSHWDFCISACGRLQTLCAMFDTVKHTA